MNRCQNSPILALRFHLRSQSPVQRRQFYREMGEADVEAIGGVLKRWWLRAGLYRDPEGDRIHAAVQAGTATGTSASAVLRRLGAP